jgi:plasmid stability protein
LSQAEQAFIDRLPEELRATATDSYLQSKAESMELTLANRHKFSVTVNEIGNLVIRGLGNRYPMGLRVDSAELLLSHVDDIRDGISEALQYIKNNPDKVAAAKKVRAEARKLEADKKKQSK